MRSLLTFLLVTEAAGTGRERPKCETITLDGSISNSYDYAGNYDKTDQLRNGAPIYKKRNGSIKYLYLHDNGYWHFYTENIGQAMNLAIWIKRVIMESTCPLDNPPPHGYWNARNGYGSDTATLEQVNWRAGTPLPTTTTTTTTPTTTMTTPTTTTKRKQRFIKFKL